MSMDQNVEFFHNYLNSSFIQDIEKTLLVQEHTLPYVSIRCCKENNTYLDIESVWKNLLEACLYLKRKHVIHLNINPTNVLVNPENNSVKLCDFRESELTRFHDAEMEGGLLKLKTEEGRDIGMVSEDGWFGRYCAVNSKFRQHSFIHWKRGTARCNGYKNCFPYLDPILECAKLFEIEDCVLIDDRIDIFSSGMTVLYYVNDDIFWNHNENILELIKSFRGPSNPRDVWLFGKTLKDASIIKGNDLRRNDKHLGIWMAMKDMMTGGEIIPEFEKAMKRKYDINFVDTLLSSINPLQTYRPCAKDSTEGTDEEVISPVFV